MNINEEQNRAKLIRKATFNCKRTLLHIIWNTISSTSSFLSFMERSDRLRFKDMTIVNKRS